MRLVQNLTALAALGLTFLSAHSALAAPCATDADCSAGFACEVVGSSSGGCVSAPCEPGGECPPAVCEPPVEELGCVPAPCNAGADCPADMVCFAFPADDCADPAPCITPGTCPEPTCTPSTEQRCVPGWLPPLLDGCATDADCGVGFRCSSETICACAVPTAPATGGAAAIPVPATGGTGGSCTCTPLPPEERSCELAPQACDTSDTCPAGWTCEANPMGVVCSGSSGGAAPGVGGASADPLPVEEECVAPDPARVCLPPYALELGDLDLGGSSDDEAGEPPLVSGAGGAPATGSGTGGRVIGTASGGAGTEAPTESADPVEEVENSPDPDTSDDGGCQMAPAAAGSAGSAFFALLAGLALVRLRRRPQR